MPAVETAALNNLGHDRSVGQRNLVTIFHLLGADYTGNVQLTYHIKINHCRFIYKLKYAIREWSVFSCWQQILTVTILTFSVTHLVVPVPLFWP
jgi:hypothetical protein